MIHAAASERRRRSLPYWLTVAALVSCAWVGGSSKATMPALLLLRPILLLLIAATLLLPSYRPANPAMRWPFMLLGLLGAVIAIQLVPLPPAIWTHFPGHSLLVEAATAVGMAQPWRPLSITPYLTLNSLVALLAPLSVLLPFARLDERERRGLLPWVAGIAVASAALGVLQMLDGPGSVLYWYGGDDDVLPTGFLANRNHQALLLAMALPIVALWTRTSRPRGRGEPSWRNWAALAIGTALLPAILATGSRSGLAVTALALVAVVLIVPRPADVRVAGRRIPGWLAYLIPIALLVVVILAGRGLSIERIADGGDLTEEKRIAALPVMIDMARDFTPFGSGFGTFDPVFRSYEPDRLLTPNYFNHAHNDLLELVLTGGIPATLLFLLFIGWVAHRIRSGILAGGTARATATTAGALLVMMLAASLTDYPVRTPLIAALAALACGWLATATDGGAASGADGAGAADRGRRQRTLR